VTSQSTRQTTPQPTTFRQTTSSAKPTATHTAPSYGQGHNNGNTGNNGNNHNNNNGQSHNNGQNGNNNNNNNHNNHNENGQTHSNGNGNSNNSSKGQSESSFISSIENQIAKLEAQLKSLMGKLTNAGKGRNN